MKLFGYKLVKDTYDPRLDYGNLNVLLQKQVTELESQTVDLHQFIDELEDKAQNLKDTLKFYTPNVSVKGTKAHKAFNDT